MNKNVPDGWDEPILEGLWQYETLFGVPRFMVLVYLPLVAFGVFYATWYFYTLAVVHGLATIATATDPEWPRILSGLFQEPGDIDP